MTIRSIVIAPIIVDTATLGQSDRLRQLFIQGTRISLAMVVPIATGLSLLAEPLVLAWVGPDFAGSVPIIHILTIAVAIRVGNSTATTLLKGSGQHRLLATSNLLIAGANLAMSIVLVRHLGLIGVALGTLIAVASVSIFVLFPAACRRVKLSTREALKTAILPPLWPLVVMASFLAITRNVISAIVPEYPSATRVDAVAGRPGVYTVKFSRLGENMLTVKYGTSQWTTLEFFVTEPLETVIQDCNTGQPVAWIALTPDRITTHPSGRIWAGRSDDYVCLFALEGGDAGSPSTPGNPPSSPVASP